MLALALLMSTLQDPPQPVQPVPDANQLAWHKRQYYAFVHFGPNTFTGNEWGLGTEDPNVFNPVDLDCRQWCRTFKEAGMSGVILTAKHHDGFALWQSKYTTHGVMASKWRDGKGDVLKDLSEACKEYGLWLGVYLSPWDRNHPTYGSDLYNDTFVAMLREVLTNYGDIKEVWFDGANGEGPNGKRQEYDWPRFVDTVRTLAPNAVIFHDGGDVRWVGNESGFVGDTNWNFLPSGHWPGDQSIYNVLNTGDLNGDKYSPGECDVSIRPGWFWRASENSKVKSLEQLKEIWYRSVGHGGNLLLNVPPNDKGLISEEDARALMEFRRWREGTFEDDLARRAKATSGARRTGAFGPEKTSDGNDLTYWATADGNSAGSVDLVWDRPQLVDHVVLSEPLALGQRIDKVVIYAENVQGFDAASGRHVVAEGTTVGNQRIFRFGAVKATKLSVSVHSRSGAACISSIKVYLGPPSVSITADATSFLDKARVELKSDNAEADVRYTLNGSDPTSQSQKYGTPITVDQSCTLRAAAFYNGKRSAVIAEQVFTRYDRSNLWPATVFIREPDPGIAFQYFEKGWQTLDQMKGAVATEAGVSHLGLNLALRKRDDHFAFAFTGVLTFTKDGIYSFSLASDDGSRLYVDDKLVIDNDGLHGMEAKPGIAPLAAGYHRVRIEYFNATGGMGLKLDWQGPGITPGPIPPDAWRS